MMFSQVPASAAWRHRDAREGFESVFLRTDRPGYRLEGHTAAVEEGQAWAVRYGNAVGYERRLQRDGGARSFTLYASAAQGCSPDLLDAGRSVLAVLEAAGTRGWADVELFLGRYGVTPAGIHVEDCSNLHFVIDGDKAMHVWPPEHWTPETAGGETVDRAESSGHREHYLSGVDPEAHFVADARPLRGRSGDLLCRPAGYWHVGQVDELSIAVNLAVYASSDAESLRMAEPVVK